MLQSVFLAFSLYSRIPVPQAEWNKKNMRFCICFLPLVGAVIGALQFSIFLLLAKISAGTFFRGAVLAVLPVLLTGGIHMDGFMDTCDAIHSWKSPCERLQILKDPHAGAFAVLGCTVYMLLMAGVWAEAAALFCPGPDSGTAAAIMTPDAGAGLAAETEAGFRAAAEAAYYLTGTARASLSGTGAGSLAETRSPAEMRFPAEMRLPAETRFPAKMRFPAETRFPTAMCLCFVLSRSLSAFAALTFPKARKEGLLRQETDPVPSGAAAAMGILSFSLLAALFLTAQLPGLCAAAASLATLVYYRRTAVKLFGGTSGDLAGWFLQLCELLTMGAIVVTARLF